MILIKLPVPGEAVLQMPRNCHVFFTHAPRWMCDTPCQYRTRPNPMVGSLFRAYQWEPILSRAVCLPHRIVFGERLMLNYDLDAFISARPLSATVRSMLE